MLALVLAKAMLCIGLLSLLACESPLSTPYPSAMSFSREQGSPRMLLQAQPQLSIEQQLDWAVGKSFATQAWVSGPASTTARDGLGPLFNANSCVGCHQYNGQGQLPEHGPGLVLRIAPSGAQHQAYGEQLQDHALTGTLAEGQITWQTVSALLANRQGIVAPLNHRRYYIKNGQYGDTSELAYSARLAPALIGMGLLDGISDEDILRHSDPDDRDGNGISGRAIQRWDAASQRFRPGKFGWKASQRSLKQQIALAFSQDIGIRSPIYPAANCPANTPNCNTQHEHEISAKLLDAVTNYIANLAIPSPRHNADFEKGFSVFQQLGCAACHIPATQTHIRASYPQPANSSTLARSETIYPFSDLLLHDMGPALADEHNTDNTPATEWRTAPLWGLGMRSIDPDHTRLLHDGRANSIHAAIFWHGGEAQLSRQQYLQLDSNSQHFLLNFLKAL